MTKSEEVAPLSKVIPNSFTLQSLPSSRVKSKRALGDLEKGGETIPKLLNDTTGIPEFSCREESQIIPGGFLLLLPSGRGSRPGKVSQQQQEPELGQTGGEGTGRGRNVQLRARLPVRAPAKIVGMGEEIKVNEALN